MEDILFKIDVWRDEFKSLRGVIGKGWKSMMIEFDGFWASDDGRKMMDLVGDGRASLERTVKVVEALLKIAGTTQKGPDVLNDKYPAASRAIAARKERIAQLEKKSNLK